MTSAPTLPADPGLLVRFRAAGQSIAWRPLIEPPWPRMEGIGTPPNVRVAHLNEEEARVEDREEPDGSSLWTVESGPVGALVLLLEIDRRGPPGQLRAWEANSIRGFPQGAIGARWGPGVRPEGPQLPLSDLVKLARYALA